MMPPMRSTIWGPAALALAFSLTAGCGKEVGDDTPGVTDDGSVTEMPDAFVPPSGYTRLIGRTWTLPTGAHDIYKCVRVTINEDMYITNIMAQAPTGTHHTVLSIAGANGTSGPDGEQDCNVGTLGMEMLYASGVGTSPLDFPDGVGIKVSKGQQIHLNLHLYNASDEGISGESAIFVKAQSTPPPTLAEMIFAGRINFSVPANPIEDPMRQYPVTGGCDVQTPYTLFAVWPHMHKLAVHQKVELLRGDEEPMILHDKDYTFLEQSYYLKSPEVQVQAGDKIQVTCDYVNTTGHLVTFGDSSDQEMCFAGLYRYPAQNAGLFQCTDIPQF